MSTDWTGWASYLAAAFAAFALLLAVPLALAGVSALLRGARRDEGAGAPRSELLADLRFAAGWTLLAYLPGAALVAATAGQGSATLAVAGAISVAAFARARFRLRGEGERGPGLRSWAALETLLVALGFFVFEAVRETTANLPLY